MASSSEASILAGAIDVDGLGVPALEKHGHAGRRWGATPDQKDSRSDPRRPYNANLASNSACGVRSGPSALGVSGREYEHPRMGTLHDCTSSFVTGLVSEADEGVLR